MDSSLQTLCQTLKNLLSQLKPQNNPLSFIVMISKAHQGKTALLKQTSLEQVKLTSLRPVSVFYNEHGIIVELGEEWFNCQELSLATTLKQLNRCYHSLKISGIILCIDIQALLANDPVQFQEQAKSHLQLLRQLGKGLNYRIDLTLFFTKLDALAGFSEFFHSEHQNDLIKPLGFSLEGHAAKEQLIKSFTMQFDQLSEMLGQWVIQKIHPARSGMKRTLIREFPLQIASLRPMIQSLIQAIPFRLFNIQSLYFSSAEQGGVSIDRLNKKIQHEYALVVQDTYPQSTNFKPYFVEGAIFTFQQETKQTLSTIHMPHKGLLGMGIGVFVFSFIGIFHHFLQTNQVLDSTKNELEQYEHLAIKPGKNTEALYHLNKASMAINQLSSNALTSPRLSELKKELHNNTQHRLSEDFLPQLTHQLEQVLRHPNYTYQDKYHALRTYLLLGNNAHFSKQPVIEWFEQYWKGQTIPAADIQLNLDMLKKALATKRPDMSLNTQLITDTRNYLFALPSQYLLYVLAKESFPKETQTITIPGFELWQQKLPIYYTKSGFHHLEKNLSTIAKQLTNEQWVLEKNTPSLSREALLEAYTKDYVNWWQQFLQKTHPAHFQNYNDGHQRIDEWRRANAINQLVDLIQKETSPDLSHPQSVFNQQIANQFTSLNLMSHGATRELSQVIYELESFITTLSVVNDQGRTAFTLAKNRFTQESSDPLSLLYNKGHALPEPLAPWALQIADDTWSLIIKDSRSYLNTQWQQTVFTAYESSIVNRYPFTPKAKDEVSMADFNRFFAQNGILNHFIETTLKPFIDTSKAQWQPKSMNGYQLPLSEDVINELMRANIINSMFFPHQEETTAISFSLQKVSLDPVVANLQLNLGDRALSDNQSTDAITEFSWPGVGAKLALNSIDGNHYELNEEGPWAFFKMLQKVNVLVDDNDSTSLQILFEINGNTGRYLLKTENPINPFIPGILNGFVLNRDIV